MNRFQRLLLGCLIFFALNHLIYWGPFNLLVCWGQSTTVTGTVKDTNGLAYAGAQMKAQLVFAGTPVSNPTVQITGVAACRANGFGSSPCNVPFAPNQGPFNLDGGGNVPGGGITLQDTSLVSPGGAQWQFTVNSNGNPPPLGTGPQTCTATLAITGVSQSISGSFAACPALSNTSASGSSTVTGLTTQGTGTDSGVANAYIATVTFPAGMSATTSGSQFSMIVNNSNTAASTINVNGSGAFGLIVSNNAGPLTGTEMTGGQRYSFLNLGSNKWVLLGSKQGAPSLTSNQVTGQMIGTLGIDGATSVFQQGFLEFFTPFTTSNAPTYRTGVTFSCFGTGGGCSGAQQVQLGYDADGVWIISGGGMAFINNVESFSEQDMFGSGTASSVILNVSDSGHAGHTSGNIFNVIDKNGRTNIQVTTNATATKMTMDDFGAIGTQSVSGCSLTAAAGGSWAGKFNSGTAGTCTVTITFPDAQTTGWACDAHDTTTPADVINQTAFSTTTATISGTTASGDVITWKCVGF